MLSPVVSFSYPNPPIFPAFAKLPVTEAQNPTPLVPDQFFDPKFNLSRKQALEWFTSGFALAFAGQWSLKSLFSSGVSSFKTEATSFETNNILRHDPYKRDELNISQAFNGALDSIYRLAQLDPAHRKTLAAYLGSGIVGYTAGNITQGGQETWVRREETRIRARLINGLQNVVQQSIRNKHQFDNELREETRQSILQLLQKNNVLNPSWFVDGLVDTMPAFEDSQKLRNYFCNPINRTLTFGTGSSSQNTKPGITNWMKPDNPLQRVRLEKGLLLTLGALTGWAVQSLIKLMRAPFKAAQFEGDKVLYETIHIKDREAWWVNGIKNHNNLLLMFGFFGVSALARAGQLLIDGLREIEVTRINAQTELSYQTHNWVSQDPAFHAIAEREGVQNDLNLLVNDLPRLKQNPLMLRERIQRILQNVSLHSAPAYYQMTPPVGLVMARA